MTLSVALITRVKRCNCRGMYGDSHFKIDAKKIGWGVTDPTGNPIIDWRCKALMCEHVNELVGKVRTGHYRGYQWHTWLRHGATSRKFAG
jgi:hypothetical protein